MIHTPKYPNLPWAKGELTNQHNYQRPQFVTWGSLTFDNTIGPYKITLFYLAHQGVHSAMDDRHYVAHCLSAHLYSLHGR